MKEKADEKVGTALVVGGGIGGMQAALDLAESGIKVYLVESKPSIGGVMSQLDKTFPTNDCAMCTIAPRLVGIGRHKDIEILTLSDVEKVEGEAGNFRVTLNRKARYVDESRCTGCGLCFASCPVVLKNDYDLGLSERKAIYTLFPQAVPNKAAIDKREERPCNAACMDRCPVHTNVLGYVRLIAEGRFREAYELNRNVNPFPSVCGRVCYAPCEEACNRGQMDEPIAIRHLKMFVADRVDADERPVPRITKSGKKVAILGAGPAGLAAANDLALLGHAVTVFEAQPEAGGMLRYGIPEYRLPRETLRKEIRFIERLGVNIKLGVQVGKDITLPNIQKDHDAVFIGVGAQGGMRLETEGSDLSGVTDGIKFLKAVNTGEKVTVGKKVAIIGGGNTAIDCARTVKRLGAAEVRIVYRRSRAEMPAAKEEIDAAEREGVEIDFLALPKRFLSENGVLTAMECIRMTLGEPDASGRRRPIPVPGSEFTVAVDMAVAALGQVTQLEFLRELGLSLSKTDTVVIDPSTGATNIPGIFSGGDVVTGAAFVIDAIAAGKKAARAIHQHLDGKTPDHSEESRQPQPLSEAAMALLKQRFPARERIAIPEVPVKDRIDNFREVLVGFTPEEAMAEAKRCLAGQIDGCIECGECERRCDAHAIRFDQTDTKVELNVGAIVLTPGFQVFDASVKSELGLGKYPNVVSALQFERILSPSGPFGGKVFRPSDHVTPKRIAFIQCVGSRDHERDYCSAVCCMYATKEALVAREHLGEDLACDIYFMDIRAYSKGFELYFERAKKEGVNYIRCRVPQVEEIPESRNLLIRYLNDEDRKATREYDMVVLSVGMQPPRNVQEISSKFGIELNQHGFCKTSVFHPAETSRKGIYVAGPFAEPKDIPETVTQASAAAAGALSLLESVKGTFIAPTEYPPETDVTGQEARVGVFVCHCGTNIASVVNVHEVVEYARTLPNVAYAENDLYTCSNDTQEKIKEKIREHGLNRVVVASCTPRTHEPLFRNTIRQGGLNPYLFEMANIRDQCSWVHMHEPDKATQKARDLVKMAVAKARLLDPLRARFLDIVKSALVIGGGIAGMSASLDLAEQGLDVFLVEKDKELGGNLRRVHYLLSGEDPQQNLLALNERVKANPRIRVFTEATVRSVKGSIGNFESEIARNGDAEVVPHGIVVVATGGKEYQTKEYLYGQDARVLTQRELEEQIATLGKQVFNGSGKKPSTVVMIQCVGSRDEERPYCSRICCSTAVKNALKIKEISPETNVYVLYRDMRTYGFKETYYTQARKNGVAFIRYDRDNKPVVSGNGNGLKVEVFDQILKMPISIPADLVVLSTGIVANEDNKTIAQLLKVPLIQDGFFLEAHMKLRPIDFATDGVFVCGLAHFPKSIEESMIQAQAAAARASTVLSKDRLELDAHLSRVIHENCDGCAYCVEPCPYVAMSLIEYMWQGSVKKVADVNESICKGCGTCMATCPKGGVFVAGFSLEQLRAQIQAALQP